MSRWLSILPPHAHKYAIDSAYLGDDTTLAWRNLGYWDANTQDYSQACRQLADHLAQAVQLKASDQVLDLGCGQGASLQHWQQVYAVTSLSAVELQQSCITQIQQHLSPCPSLYTGDFYQLADLQLAQVFDVVLCIDAAYHAPVERLLNAVRSVLKPQGRLGFHCLIWTEKFAQLSRLQQQRYKYLLKAADVNFYDLNTAVQLRQLLQQNCFDQIEVKDISAAVLAGFADHVQRLAPPQWKQRMTFDYAKIAMTAKLCRYLYQDGVIRYVQVSAQELN